MTGILTANYSLGSIKIDVEQDFLDKRGRSFSEVFERTGVRIRHQIDKGDDSLSLAKAASIPILKEINRELVECLILVTQSPTSLIPSTSFFLHKELGLSKECANFDLPHGCSGFVYGLLLGESLLSTAKIHNFLLVTSETYSKYIKIGDSNTRPIFSDGAAAFYFDENNTPKIISTFFYTDGTGAEHLCLENRQEDSGDSHLVMNGMKVFTFTMSVIPNAVQILLSRANLELREIDCFIFHQASKVVLDSIKERLGIPDEKMFNCLEGVGNTVSSSVPIALINAVNDGMIHKGSKVLLIGFGVGLSVSGAVVVF